MVSINERLPVRTITLWLKILTLRTVGSIPCGKLEEVGKQWFHRRCFAMSARRDNPRGSHTT